MPYLNPTILLFSVFLLSSFQTKLAALDADPDPAPGEVVQIVPGKQTKLGLNLLDQCMSRPKVGPDGAGFVSAMRIKFVLAAKRSENSGSATKQCDGGG